MSTPLYDALVTKIRTWVNRDSNVITDALIADFLDYSADLCYRKLRIPPLEYTHTYETITALSGLGETELTVPPDLSEFIQLRKTDADGNSYVFDERTSLLAMQDHDHDKQSESFARRGSTLVFYPAAKVGDIYEMHYYRRLPDMDAVYEVNETNRLAALNTISTSGATGAVETPASSGNYYVGNEVPNWLRDENERILLWGAVAYAFDYVGEDERAAKFNAQQLQGIQELNQEEELRKVRGGLYRQTFSVTDQF
tara:strand:+ start:7788 stop:8552 length:765 start_codon:yes stop_codon:yes gene_type:complete